MTGPGWYDDPLIPGGKRWWTGQAWTEEARPPAEGGGWISEAVAAEPAPWVPGGAPRAAAHAPTGPRRPYGSIVDWLGGSFRGLAGQLPSAIALFIILPAGLAIAGYVAMHTALADVTVFFDDYRLEGIRRGPFLAALMIQLVVIVGWMAASLGGLHFLTTIHRGPSLGAAPDPVRSLGIGFGRIPRLLGVNLIVTAAAAAVGGMGFGLLVALNRSGTEEETLRLSVTVTALLVGVPLALWLLVKLAFLPVAVVAVPPGSSPLVASWRAGNNRFLPLLARLLVWLAIVAIISVPAQTLMQFVIAPRLASGLEVNALGDLRIDGRPLESVGSIRIGDLMRSPAAAALWIGLGAALNGTVQAVSASTLSSLWVDGESNPLVR